jgi:hypothetical protein
VPARTAKEAIETFVGFLNETLSCVTEDRLSAYQESAKLYKVLYEPLAPITSISGTRYFLSVTQVCTVEKIEGETFKVHTREYSYYFSEVDEPAHHGIVSYHWHPNDFAVRDPHLHLKITPNTGYPEIERKIHRAHFPTSRVCLEDFIQLLISAYDIKPLFSRSRYTTILRKNKAAFGKDATWFVVPRKT